MESIPLQMPQTGNDLYFVGVGVVLCLWIFSKFGMDFYKVHLEKNGKIAARGAEKEAPACPPCQVDKLADEISVPLREIAENLRALNAQVREQRAEHARTHERIIEMQTAQKFERKAGAG